MEIFIATGGMSILKNASKFRRLLHGNPKIKVTEFVKENFGQTVIDNPLIKDYDNDGEITIKDYQIVINWIQQGSPCDIELYNKQRDLAPVAETLPTVETLEVKIKDTSESVYNEYSSDWNDDGDVDELDRDILASFVLQGKPSSVDEYNLNRHTYPRAKDLPNLVTANYTCPDGNCCNDDYDEDGILSSKDALIHYAFTSLIDWSSKPEDVLPIDYYNQVAPDGFKFKPKHLPTVGCGDFQEDGSVDSKDSLIYYAWSSLTEWNKKPTKKRAEDYYYENSLPGFKFAPEHSPVCSTAGEDECIGTKKECVGQEDKVDWRDYLIFYKWLEECKCDSVDCYNCARDEYPEACRLPVQPYHNVGVNKIVFDDTYSGIENL